MTGFNSFVVKECTVPAQGLLLLRLGFNEITIATTNRNREQGHRDRNYHADHFNRYHTNRYRNSWADEQDYRDYGSYQRRNSDREYDGHGHYDRGYDRGFDREFDYNREHDRNHDRDYDRYHDRNHDRNVDRGYERDIVQAYGVVLEFGYISKTAAESNYDRHLAGVTISLADVKLR